MLQRRKLLLLTLLLCLLLPVTGCWDKTEIEDLGIAGVMGIDKVNIEGTEQYLVILQVLKLVQRAGSSGEGSGVGGQASSILYKGIGLTLDDALANIQATTPRRLFLADLGAVIVSEKVAAENLKQVIDFLGRSREIRLLRGMLVAKGSVEKLLRAQPQFSLTLGREIKDTVETNKGLSANVYYPTIKEFINELMSPSASSVTGTLRMASQIELSPQSPTPGGSEKNTISLEGLAVFAQGKKVGELTKTETVGYLLLTGRGIGGVIPVQVLDPDQTLFSYQIRSVRVKKVPYFEDRLQGFRIELTVEGDIAGIANFSGKLNEQVIADLEKQMALTVKSLTEETLRKTQEQGADVFGLANVIYARYPQLWSELKKDWPKVYRELSIEVIPEVRIKNTGFFLDMLRL